MEIRSDAYLDAPDTDADPLERGEAPAPAGPALGLDDLSREARGRIVHFIATSTLAGGVAPVAVAALYADLSGEELSLRYVDQRFALRQVPPGWREVEDRVLDLEEAARQRGVDLAGAWRRATDVVGRSEDPLEQLARLAGIRSSSGRWASAGPSRSIFDDPEDLDELGETDDSEAAQYAPLGNRLPEIVDLAPESQDRIRRYAVEERLEHGLPPFELLELYRALETAGDERARQYLDRIFEAGETPPDWLETQRSAQRVLELAERRGRDAGRLYAEVLRASPGTAPLVALELVAERLQLM